MGGYIDASAMKLPAVVELLFALPFRTRAAGRSSCSSEALPVSRCRWVYCAMATRRSTRWGALADRLLNVLYFTAWLLIGFLFTIFWDGASAGRAKPEAVHPLTA